VPDVPCHSVGAVLDLALQVWNQGGEGLMLKDALSPYERKRTGAWQKIKKCNVAKWAGRVPILSLFRGEC
jgi:ATP-dependent DNA ligase